MLKPPHRGSAGAGLPGCASSRALSDLSSCHACELLGKLCHHRLQGDIGDEVRRALLSSMCRDDTVLRCDPLHTPPGFHPQRTPKNTIMALPSQLEKFKTLCKQFCRHKAEPRAVLDFAFNTFGEEKAMVLVNDLTLSRIQDPERRATLLLSLMYLRPNTKTNCCGANFCFNCKRDSHHDSCVEEFDENKDLVRCRMCRVLLLKVEGCDDVDCVCGFNMDWPLEQRLRRDQKRGFMPVDIFDIPLTNKWLEFRPRLALLMRGVQKTWLCKRMIKVRSLVRPIFAAYMWRFRKILTTQLKSAWGARLCRRVDLYLPAVRGILRAAVASFVWRRRFTKALMCKETELYWKAFHRWHPGVAEAEEINALFSIATFEDDD